jgi:hypothetical protein
MDGFSTTRWEYYSDEVGKILNISVDFSGGALA